jgi:hypothetical protein
LGAGRHVADWRNAAHYVLLAHGGHHAFAWEWLRRSEAYRAEICENAGGKAAAFGLHRFEPTDNGFGAARPLWRSEVDRYVVNAWATKAPTGVVGADFAPLAGLAIMAAGQGGEHWLWSDGNRQIRLDVHEGTLCDGPVLLEFRVPGAGPDIGSVLPRLVTIKRLAALVRNGRMLPQLFPPARRAARWAMILRTHDALAAGASQRDIAEQIFGLDSPLRWRIEAPSLWHKVQRLVFAARAAGRSDPLIWLGER